MIPRCLTYRSIVGNLIEIPTYEKQKIEKTHAKEKQLHAQDNIYWFGNLPTSMELQKFYYYQGKVQSVATIFLFHKKHGNNTHN